MNDEPRQAREGAAVSLFIFVLAAPGIELASSPRTGSGVAKH